MEFDVLPEAWPFVTLADAFTPAELDAIERLGDASLAGKATLLGVPQDARYDTVRVTETAWLEPTNDSRWLYAGMSAIVRTINEKYFQFELLGYADSFQYTIYRAQQGGHYAWHADHGAKTGSPRKLSLSLQLSDPGSYQGCNLETSTGIGPYAAP